MSVQGLAVGAGVRHNDISFFYSPLFDCSVQSMS